MVAAKVLLVVDSHRWAFGHCAHGIAKHAPPEYDVTVLDNTEFGNRYERRHDAGLEWDAICQFAWQESCVSIRGCRLSTVVAHHGAFEAEGNRLATAARNIVRARAVLPQFDAVLCFNRQLETDVRAIGANAVYAIPGVDTQRFKPAAIEPKRNSSIWVGQRVWFKHAEVAERLGVDEIVDNMSAGDVLTSAEVAKRMRRHTCYVCTSESEGGPMPMLESLACGLSVHTTLVGFARDLPRELFATVWPDWKAIRQDVWWESTPRQIENAAYVREEYGWTKRANEWLKVIVG